MTQPGQTNPEILRAASIQMVSCADLEKNLNKAEKLIAEAAADGAELVVLPEYFAFMGMKEKDKFKLIEKDGDGPVQNWLQEQAARHQVWLVGGSHTIESTEQERPFGRCYVYNASGQCVGHYDKIHLFDVAVEDNYQNYRESAYTAPGSLPFCFQSPWGKVGVAICYDLRFPELFRAMLDQGCELFVLPAAFTKKTGQAHWHSLLRARAIENLSAIIASAQGGEHQNGRLTYGHSLILDCWGNQLAEKVIGEGVVIADIDLSFQQKRRKAFPALSHRRL